MVKEDMFVDRAVYSRNRAFRLYLSSKAGKEATLQPTGIIWPADLVRTSLTVHVVCDSPSCSVLSSHR